MHYIGLGGSAVPAAVAERATALGISIVRMYGSTEHPSITGCTHDDPIDKRLHTDGRPLPGVEVRLVDDDGRTWTSASRARSSAAGPDCFAGYTDPALTAAAFDDDGWFPTGDVGVLDDDGYLTITDRKKDIIIRGGENVSAARGGGACCCACQASPRCAVVAAPDERLGEHGCAFVRLLPGAEPSDLDRSVRHLDAAGLARQKWPEELCVVDDFPRTRVRQGPEVRAARRAPSAVSGRRSARRRAAGRASRSRGADLEQLGALAHEQGDLAEGNVLGPLDAVPGAPAGDPRSRSMCRRAGRPSDSERPTATPARPADRCRGATRPNGPPPWGRSGS